MSDLADDRLNLDDEDRLPWLEPADGYDGESSGVSPLRILGLVLSGLVLLGLIIGAIYAARAMMSGSNGHVELIEAPKGSYKIPAAEADAKKFHGEGDASYATSEGMGRDGQIDPNRLPETPVAAGPSQSANDVGMTRGDAASDNQPSTKPQPKVSAKVQSVDDIRKDQSAPKQAASSGTALIQLGAYASTATAQEAWGKLARRFSYLSAMSTNVQPVTVGSTTLYRLRASAGSVADANGVCGKLKVAGESCIVVK
jgi:cell division septation protein DedD